MKVVIEIDEEIYESAKSNPNYYPTYHFEKIWKAIVNGTPLPKGHGDLIDRDALSGEIFCYADITDAHTCFNSIDKIVKDAPTIIEAEEENENEE